MVYRYKPSERVGYKNYTIEYDKSIQSLSIPLQKSINREHGTLKTSRSNAYYIAMGLNLGITSISLKASANKMWNDELKLNIESSAKYGHSFINSQILKAGLKSFGVAINYETFGLDNLTGDYKIDLVIAVVAEIGISYAMGIVANYIFGDMFASMIGTEALSIIGAGAWGYAVGQGVSLAGHLLWEDRVHRGSDLAGPFAAMGSIIGGPVGAIVGAFLGYILGGFKAKISKHEGTYFSGYKGEIGFTSGGATSHISFVDGELKVGYFVKNGIGFVDRKGTPISYDEYVRKIYTNNDGSMNLEEYDYNKHREEFNSMSEDKKFELFGITEENRFYHSGVYVTAHMSGKNLFGKTKNEFWQIGSIEDVKDKTKKDEDEDEDYIDIDDTHQELNTILTSKGKTSFLIEDGEYLDTPYYTDKQLIGMTKMEFVSNYTGDDYYKDPKFLDEDDKEAQKELDDAYEKYVKEGLGVEDEEIGDGVHYYSGYAGPSAPPPPRKIPFDLFAPKKEGLWIYELAGGAEWESKLAGGVLFSPYSNLTPQKKPTQEEAKNILYYRNMMFKPDLAGSLMFADMFKPKEYVSRLRNLK
jgi:hypothetical protein